MARRRKSYGGCEERGTSASQSSYTSHSSHGLQVRISLFLGMMAVAMPPAGAEPTRNYTIEGTLLMLPSLQTLPSGAWKPARTEYFAITYTSHRNTPEGNEAIQSRVVPAVMYSPPPVEVVTDTEDPAAADRTLLRLLGTDRVLAVPKTPWLPSEQRSLMRTLPSVYFESAGENTLIRRTLPEPPSVGLSAVVAILEPGATVNTEKALDAARCSLELENSHIEEVAASLASQTSISIVVDPTVVAPRTGCAAPDRTRYVTDGIVPYVKLANVSLREALEAICRPLHLKIDVRPGLVWITSADAFANHPLRDTKRGDTPIVQVTTTWASLSDRAILPQAAFLDIGRPTVSEVRGIGWIPAPLNEWVVVTLQDVNESPSDPMSPGGLHGAGSVYYALLLRVQAQNTKDPS